MYSVVATAVGTGTSVPRSLASWDLAPDVRRCTDGSLGPAKETVSSLSHMAMPDISCGPVRGGVFPRVAGRSTSWRRDTVAGRLAGMTARITATSAETEGDRLPP